MVTGGRGEGIGLLGRDQLRVADGEGKPKGGPLGREGRGSSPPPGLDWQQLLPP